jgi:hypothetical protein
VKQALTLKGGVCWRHEAKANAKQCGYEGCNNGVVNSGFLLRHGAKRNICSGEGCTNSAVQGYLANVAWKVCRSEGG